MANDNLALSDIKVLELGDYISAPYAGKLMADLGAEVIKVEATKVGDESRRQGPFPNDVPHLERSGLFLWLNTNKKSVSLNLTTRTALDIVYELCKAADVVIDNRRPSEQQELGIGYETLSEINPSLVVTAVTAYGHDGPYKEYKGYAINAAASAGVPFRIGHPDREPLTSPLSRSDYWGAINAAGATMAALHARRKTGKGQFVDISSVESIATFVQVLSVIDYVDVGFYPARRGHRLDYMSYPWVILPAKEGFFSLITVQERHWSRFIELLGEPEWSKEERYRDLQAMGKEYPEEVDQLVRPILADKDKHELWEVFRANKVPFHAVQTTEDLVNCSHLNERGFFVDKHHPEAGTIKYPGAPYQLSETPWRMRTAAPKLGQHNAEILCGRLGFSKVDLVDLRRTGII